MKRPRPGRRDDDGSTRASPPPRRFGAASAAVAALMRPAGAGPSSRRTTRTAAVHADSPGLATHALRARLLAMQRRGGGEVPSVLVPTMEEPWALEWTRVAVWLTAAQLAAVEARAWDRSTSAVALVTQSLARFWLTPHATRCVAVSEAEAPAEDEAAEREDAGGSAAQTHGAARREPGSQRAQKGRGRAQASKGGRGARAAREARTRERAQRRAAWVYVLADEVVRGAVSELAALMELPAGEALGRAAWLGLALDMP